MERREFLKKLGTAAVTPALPVPVSFAAEFMHRNHGIFIGTPQRFDDVYDKLMHDIAVAIAIPPSFLKHR